MSRESALQAAVTPPTETPAAPVAETSPAAPPQEMQSTVFAKLAAKEAKLVKEREEFKAQQEQLLAEREDVKKVMDMVKEFEQLKNTDRLAALKKLGFSDTDLFEAMAAVEPKEESVEDKAAKIAQAKIEEYAKTQAEKQAEAEKARNDEIINRYKADISKTYADNKEKYQLSNFYGEAATELAYQLVLEISDKEKKVISAQEAADLVENYYEEHYKQLHALKTPKTPEPAPVVPEAPKSRTLTNSVSASSTSLAARETRRETAAEKRARLIAQLQQKT